MKLSICCPSGLRIEFDGDAADLRVADRVFGVLAEFESRLTGGGAAGGRDVPPAPPLLEPAPPFVPFPDPAADLTGQPDADQGAPSAAPGAAALPPVAAGNGADTPAAFSTGEAPPDAPLSERQQRVIDAVEQLGECTTSQVVAALGGSSEKAMSRALARLRDRGLVAHNGGHAKAARWRPVGYTQPEAQPLTSLPTSPRVIGRARREQAEHDRAQRLRDGILRIVAEHGPTTPAWIADQLVKNRREIAAVMREMARCGVIVETIDGGYDTIRDQQATAA